MNTTNEGEADHREKMLQAYKFALDNNGDKGVGLDYASTPVWKAYIDFMKAGEGVGDVRKAYRQAIASPKQGIDGLWREYNEWERSINAITAKKAQDL